MRNLNLYCLLCTILCAFTLTLNATGPVPTKVKCPRDKAAILKAAKPKAKIIKKKKFKKIGAPKAALKQEVQAEEPIKAEPVKTQVIKTETTTSTTTTVPAKTSSEKQKETLNKPVNETTQQVQATATQAQQAKKN